MTRDKRERKNKRGHGDMQLLGPQIYQAVHVHTHAHVRAHTRTQIHTQTGYGTKPHTHADGQTLPHRGPNSISHAHMKLHTFNCPT